jgi:hypothetical protein
MANGSFASLISKVKKKDIQVVVKTHVQPLSLILIGCFSQLNQLAHEANAQCIIHTGDFGFYGKKKKEKTFSPKKWDVFYLY